MHCTARPKTIVYDVILTSAAHSMKGMDGLPVKIKKGKSSSEEIHYAIIRSNGRIALRKRGTNGIWAGLYEPPRLQAAPKNGEELAPSLCIN